MDILKDICDQFEIDQGYADNIEDDDDILNCPLGYKLQFNKESGKVEIGVFADEEDRVSSTVINNFNAQKTGVEFDKGLPTGLFMSEPETDQLYDQLMEQHEYEDLVKNSSAELSHLRDEFWLTSIEEFESKELFECLIQNDGTSCYKVNMLTGALEGKKLGYLPEMNKKSDNSKDDTKIADFRKEYLIRKPISICQEDFKTGLNALGVGYLEEMDETMDQGGELLDLVEHDLIKDNYDELNQANILPTSQRETKYLLGINEDNDSENQIENYLYKVIGGKPKNDYDQYTKNRRQISNKGGIDLNKPIVKSSYNASFDELMKAYEETTGRKIIKVKTKGKKKRTIKSKIDYVKIPNLTFVIAICHSR